jgi:hypothetical protein
MATPANSHKRWSPAEVTKLRNEAANDTSTPEIARRHGRSEDAIRDEASRKGISLEPRDRSK